MPSLLSRSTNSAVQSAPASRRFAATAFQLTIPGGAFWPSLSTGRARVKEVALKNAVTKTETAQVSICILSRANKLCVIFSVCVLRKLLRLEVVFHKGKEGLFDCREAHFLWSRCQPSQRSRVGHHRGECCSLST